MTEHKTLIAVYVQLTIDGVNLGRSYQDVAGAVTAANVRCDVDQDLYVTASRIVCRTRPSPVQKTARNPIIVKLRDEHKYTAISNDSFMYVDPLVTRVEPLRGTSFLFSFIFVLISLKVFLAKISNSKSIYICMSYICI